MIFAKKVLFLLTLLFFSHSISSSQGLNNNYPADSIDVVNGMALLGIDMFKFPVKSTEKCYINIITEEYRADTLYHTRVTYDSTSDFFKKYKLYEVYEVDSIAKWLRIYSYDKNDSLLKIKLCWSGIIIEYGLDVEPNNDIGYRAYDFSDLKVGEKTALMIRYSKESTTEPRHCPGGRSPEAVAKIYDRVIVISAELFVLYE